MEVTVSVWRLIEAAVLLASIVGVAFRFDKRLTVAIVELKYIAESVKGLPCRTGAVCKIKGEDHV